MGILQRIKRIFKKTEQEDEEPEHLKFTDAIYFDLSGISKTVEELLNEVQLNHSPKALDGLMYLLNENPLIARNHIAYEIHQRKEIFESLDNERKVEILLLLNESDKIIKMKEHALPGLIKLLERKTEDQRVKRVATWLIRKIAEKDVDISAAAPILTDMTRIKEVAKRAKEALQKINLDNLDTTLKLTIMIKSGNTEDILKMGKNALPELTKLLKHRDSRVVEKSIEIIGDLSKEIDVSESVPEIARVLINMPYLKEKVISVLLELHENNTDVSSALPTLTKLLTDKKWHIKAMDPYSALYFADTSEHPLNTAREIAKVIYKIGFEKIDPKDKALTLLLLKKTDEIKNASMLVRLLNEEEWISKEAAATLSKFSKDQILIPFKQHVKEWEEMNSPEKVKELVDVIFGNLDRDRINLEEKYEKKEIPLDYLVIVMLKAPEEFEQLTGKARPIGLYKNGEFIEEVMGELARRTSKGDVSLDNLEGEAGKKVEEYLNTDWVRQLLPKLTDKDRRALRIIGEIFSPPEKDILKKGMRFMKPKGGKARKHGPAKKSFV